MTTLQKIVKEAKALRKKYPKKYAKWTDYVKAASKKISGLDKVRKTGNKTTVHYTKKAPATKKKAAPKKAVQSSLFGVKKKAAPRSTHKDTKSHNVNIRVVSGTPDIYSVRDRLEKMVKTDIELLAKYQQKLKDLGGKGSAATVVKKSIANIKKMLAHDKKQLREQNKLINQLLK